MFGFFPNAVGVANVRDFAADMDHLPRWITTARSGAGFVELAKRADRGAPAMNLPRPPAAVIFDMDGLLFDTETALQPRRS